MSNVIYMSLKKAKKAVVLCVLAQKYLPKYVSGKFESFGAILWGESGIGKNGVTNDLGVEMSKTTGESYIQIDCNLSGMSPEDIHGVPVVQGEVLKYFSSLSIPSDSKGIFRLDEIDRPCYFQTLIEIAKYALDRTDHRHNLPNGMFVLGMGNGASDSNTQQLSDHLKGRFVHLYVSTNMPESLDSQVEYMEKQGYEESVIRMYKASPVKTRDEFEEIALYHNRSISFANAIMKAYKDLKKANADFGDVLLAVLAGTIGKANAIEMIRLEEMKDLPTLKQVSNDPLNAMIPNDLSLRHRYLTVLVNDASNNKALASGLVTYIARYPREMARFAYDKLVLDCPDIVKTVEYIAWSNGN